MTVVDFLVLGAGVWLCAVFFALAIVKGGNH